MNKTEIFDKALKCYGVEAQLGVLQEECAELIVEGSHVLRGRTKLSDNFIEELVDAIIICEQFKHYLITKGHGRDLYNVYHRKINRLEDRLNKNPQGVPCGGLPGNQARDD